MKYTITILITAMILAMACETPVVVQPNDVIITTIDTIPESKCGHDIKCDQVSHDTIAVTMDSLISPHGFRILPIRFAFVDDTTALDTMAANELCYANVSDLNEWIIYMGYHAVIDEIFLIQDTTDIIDVFSDFNREESYSVYQSDDAMTVFIYDDRPGDSLLGYVWPIYDYLLEDPVTSLAQRNNRNRMILSDTGMKWIDPFVHEFGHYTGLGHNGKRCNMMHATLGTSCFYSFNAEQLDTMEYILEHRDYQWRDLSNIAL